MLQETAGINIKKARVSKGLSQGELADKVNTLTGKTWVQNTIYKIESNNRSLSVDELGEIAQALEVPTESLLHVVRSEEEETLMKYTKSLLSTFKAAREALDEFEILKENLPNPETLPVAYAERAKGALDEYRHWYKILNFDPDKSRVVHLEGSELTSENSTKKHPTE